VLGVAQCGGGGVCVGGSGGRQAGELGALEK
jgi:hypothetical protein